MPTFSHDLPANPRGNSLPIRRTPATHPLDAIVTSEDLIGCMTHWYHGSTVPCEDENCKPHQEGIPFRWHSYLTAVDNRSNFHFLFEVTRLGAEPFVAYREMHGTIRGCLFRAERHPRRHNGRVLIQTKTASLEERVLPAPPNLLKVLAILWGLPEHSIRTPDRNPETNQPQVHANTPEDQFQCPSSSQPAHLKDAFDSAVQRATMPRPKTAPVSAVAETTAKDSTSPEIPSTRPSSNSREPKRMNPPTRTR